MAFFFPRVYAGVDWRMGYEFLDKELQQVVRDAELGRRLVDKLVRVWRKDGEETWVLVHLEVQGRVDPEFAKRMYEYNYRLFDRYDRQVASLAVLTDRREDWRPDSFGYELWGCEISIRFPVVKLLDYESRWDALEQSTNPFALIVMADLKAQATRRDPEGRLHWKLTLVKMLYQKGYTKEDILELFRFVDWLMALPEDLEPSFAEAIKQYEEETRMPYVTSIERRGIQQGIQQGTQLGLLQMSREAIIEVLEARFDIIPRSAIETINGMDNLSILKSLLKKAATIESLDAFMKVLEKVSH